VRIYLQLVYSAWISVRKIPKNKINANASNPGCTKPNISLRIRWGFVGGRSKNVALLSKPGLLYTSCTHDRIFLISISFSVAAHRPCCRRFLRCMMWTSVLTTRGHRYIRVFVHGGNLPITRGDPGVIFKASVENPREEL